MPLGRTRPEVAVLGSTWPAQPHRVARGVDVVQIARPSLRRRGRGEMRLCGMRKPRTRLAQTNDCLSGRLGSDGIEDALVERFDQVLHVHRAASILIAHSNRASPSSPSRRSQVGGVAIVLSAGRSDEDFDQCTLAKLHVPPL
jgi:hypothetical protein